MKVFVIVKNSCNILASIARESSLYMQTCSPPYESFYGGPPFPPHQPPPPGVLHDLGGVGLNGHSGLGGGGLIMMGDSNIKKGKKGFKHEDMITI